VLGYDDRIELSPSSWLREGESVAEQRASLDRALAREPERLLLTHGGPRAPAGLQL
jgi:hypothetical protein